MDQLLREYEMVVVLNPALDDEALAALNQRIGGWITSGGGTVTNTNVWGRRQLAYQIGKHTSGIYVQFDFQLAPSASRDLERNLRLEENVVRHMVVRCDEM
jgi:small subunit ribosomal protein S6